MSYWISTISISVVLVISALSYLFHAPTIDGIKELGFPNYFRLQLIVLKLLAVLVLLYPAMPIQYKEWAYAGVALFFITAIVAHIAHGDSYLITVLNVIFIFVLLVSRYHLK